MAPTPAMTPDEIERGYNNRAAVPDHQRWLDEWIARSASAKQALSPSIDLAYGSGADEMLDLYVPKKK